MLSMLPIKSRMKLTTKLPLTVVGLSLCAAIAVGLVGYFTSAAALKDEARARLQSVVEARKQTLSSYLGSIGEDLRIVASNPTTRQAPRGTYRCMAAAGWRPDRAIAASLH